MRVGQATLKDWRDTFGLGPASDARSPARGRDGGGEGADTEPTEEEKEFRDV